MIVCSPCSTGSEKRVDGEASPKSPVKAAEHLAEHAVRVTGTDSAYEVPEDDAGVTVEDDPELLGLSERRGDHGRVAPRVHADSLPQRGDSSRVREQP